MKVIREAFSIIDSYKNNWILTPYTEKEYLAALIVQRQYEVLITTMNERQRLFFEDCLRCGKYDFNVSGERFDYKEIFDNWVVICCKSEANSVKSIDAVRLGVTLQHIREKKN